MHAPPIDNLIAQSTSIFKQFLLAHNALEIGGDTIAGFSDNACIEATVGLNVEIEPIPLYEVKHYRAQMPQFLLEIFHGKLVQTWQECLATLFCVLLDKHFSDERRFEELKRCQIYIDFRESSDLITQVKNSLIKNFDFDAYKDKVKLINSVFNPAGNRSEHLFNIDKHVQIRNSFQHKNGKIDEFFLEDLGVRRIALLNNSAQERKYGLNDKIELSIPELDYFRRSIALIGQTWRKWNG